jgi:glycerol-3-phosphate O-acyltransferase/dihydroxyacetone phosphate acyltransferase
MLYSSLRFLVLITVRIFFNSILVRNLENVPEKGPLIIAPNHPSTFLDPLVTLIWIKRPIYFLAKSEAFSSPFKKWLYNKLYMIPIYRKQDSADSSAKNLEVFSACYDLLAQGKVIIIFPEGISENERRLHKIKTGIARIALEAEEKYDFKLGVKIVCTGINYTNPRKFQSKLFVQFGSPLNAADFKEDYRRDQFETVRKLTAQVAKSLESLIVITSNDKTDRLVRKIETLYTNELKKSLNLTNDETEQIFIIGQHISNAVDYYDKLDQERVRKLEEKIESYFNLLKQHQIRDLTVAKIAHKRQAIRKLFKYLPSLIVGFPAYFYGLIFNYFPFKLPGLLARKMTSDITYQGPINMVSGIFTFAGFYLVYCLAFYFIFPKPIILLLFLISLPICGFISFYYWNYLLRVFEDLRLLSTFEKSKTTYPLRELRNQIIQELNQTKDEYLS